MAPCPLRVHARTCMLRQAPLSVALCQIPQPSCPGNSLQEKRSTSPTHVPGPRNSSPPSSSKKGKRLRGLQVGCQPLLSCSPPQTWLAERVQPSTHPENNRLTLNRALLNPCPDSCLKICSSSFGGSPSFSSGAGEGMTRGHSGRESLTEAGKALFMTQRMTEIKSKLLHAYIFLLI